MLVSCHVKLMILHLLHHCYGNCLGFAGCLPLTFEIYVCFEENKMISFVKNKDYLKDKKATNRIRVMEVLSFEQKHKVLAWFWGRKKQGITNSAELLKRMRYILKDTVICI